VVTVVVFVFEFGVMRCQPLRRALYGNGWHACSASMLA